MKTFSLVPHNRRAMDEFMCVLNSPFPLRSVSGLVSPQRLLKFNVAPSSGEGKQSH